MRAFSVSLVFLLLAILIGVVVVRRTMTSRGPAGRQALARLEVPDSAEAGEALGRWRDRARRWRTAVAFPVILAAMVASLAVQDRIAFGLLNTVGGAPLWSDALVAGLLAAALGAFGAELHHLRRPPTGPRTADLRPRDTAELRRPGARRRRAVLVGCGAGALGLHVLATEIGGATGLPFAALAALVILGICEAVEARIAGRPRPALPPDLDRADRAVRRLAVHSVDDAASGASLLLVGWAAMGSVGTLPPDAPVDGPLVFGTLAVLGCSIWWAYRSWPANLLAEVTGRRPA